MYSQVVMLERVPNISMVYFCSTFFVLIYLPIIKTDKGILVVSHRLYNWIGWAILVYLNNEQGAFRLSL